MTEPTESPDLSYGYTIKFNNSDAVFHVSITGAVRHIGMAEFTLLGTAGVPHVDGGNDTAAFTRLVAEARVSQGFLQD